MGLVRLYQAFFTQMISLDYQEQIRESSALFKVNKKIIYATGLLIHVGYNDYIEYKVEFAYNQSNKHQEVING